VYGVEERPGNARASVNRKFIPTAGLDREPPRNTTALPSSTSDPDSLARSLTGANLNHGVMASFRLFSGAALGDRSAP
jgi:hypothetical protein